jgi:hypothetical protein
MNRSRRALLFGSKKEEPKPAAEFVGLRDLRPRSQDADWIAKPAERALSAEVAQDESPPPWASAAEEPSP